MRIHDRVYGEWELDEPVLLDLMRTVAMRRLDGVLQHGVTALIGITRPVTRLEHSLGVTALVRRMGGGLLEQVAALLHDVSHTAFSHVMDYVFDGHESQSLHEDKKEEYLAGTDVPGALSRHGIDWRAVLHEEAFGLLEQPAPALCADRLDYFLRDSLDLGLARPADVAFALEHLAVHNGLIVADDLQAAGWMGYTFIAADQASWANLREVGLYELAARAIRRGLRVGAIHEADIWGTDAEVWAKLHAWDDAELQRELALVSPDTRVEWDEDRPTFRVSTKLRTIDPDVLVEGRLARLSALDAEFAKYRADYLSSKKGKWPIRVTARE